jgi:hypothetical protein
MLPVVELMVAMLVLVLLHMPPGAGSVSSVVIPTHAVGDPIIVPADGNVLTVTVAVVTAVPQLLETK